MPFTVTAAVTVCAAPELLDEDRQPTTAVFPIADAQQGTYRAQAVSMEQVAVGEVRCRGALARQSLAQLRAGDQIIVTGTLGLRASLESSRESPHVLLAIEATHIGINLTAKNNEPKYG